MKITRQVQKNYRQYFIDGKKISVDALNEFCKKFLTADGLQEMWRTVIDKGECTIELNFTPDEQSIIERQNAELQQKDLEIAALEKKLMQFRIKAAKYDCIKSTLKTA